MGILDPIWDVYIGLPDVFGVWYGEFANVEFGGEGGERGEWGEGVDAIEGGAGDAADQWGEGAVEWGKGGGVESRWRFDVCNLFFNKKLFFKCVSFISPTISFF